MKVAHSYFRRKFSADFAKPALAMSLPLARAYSRFIKPLICAQATVYLKSGGDPQIAQNALRHCSSAASAGMALRTSPRHERIRLKNTTRRARKKTAAGLRRARILQKLLSSIKD
jgi:hypothetical protein